MANFNPANIERALRGMKFPGDKQAILAKARENNTPQQEIDALNRLPEKQYTNPTEVTEALSDEGGDGADDSNDEM